MMKHLCVVTWLTWLCIYGLGVAEPAQRLTDPPPAPQQFAVKQMALDDTLIRLAQQANTNIIADASDFPATTATISGAWSGSWTEILDHFARSQQMTDLPYSATAVLLWQQPSGDEVVKLGRALASRKDLAIGPVNSDKTFATAVRSYLRQTLKWDGQKPPILYIRLSDLPGSLRDQVIVKAQSDAQLNVGFMQATLTDEFWNSAFLHIESDRLSPGHPDMLRIAGMGGGAMTSMALTILSPPRGR